MINRSIGLVTLVVDEYEPAIRFFVEILGFSLIEDTELGEGKRWVVVAAGASGTSLLLARSKNTEETQAIGRQTGGRVGFFLETDDFMRDFADYSARGVRFLEPPRQEAYGMVAVFEDYCGNRWDLIEPQKTL
jgi:catechol 2,3-dioxygenase-like lactoylglutathione lyase family enzyme